MSGDTLPSAEPAMREEEFWERAPLVSLSRAEELLRLWVQDHPSIEYSVYDGTYSQDVYIALLELRDRRLQGGTPAPAEGGETK